MELQKKYDVFISSKSEDYPIAEKVYDFLVDNGLTVFLASRELHIIGEAEYSEAVDEAIDSTHHMIVVTTSLEYLNSKWVRYEWTTYANDLRSNYKEGNLLTILGPDVKLKNLPTALRHKQSFSIESYKDNILEYLKDKTLETTFRPYRNQNIEKSFIEKCADYIKKKKGYRIACVLVILAIIVGVIFTNKQIILESAQPAVDHQQQYLDSLHRANQAQIERLRQDSIARALQAEAERLAQERARLEEDARKVQQQRKAEAASRAKTTAATTKATASSNASKTTSTEADAAPKQVTIKKIDPFAEKKAKADNRDAAACYEVAMAYKEKNNLSAAFNYMKSAAEQGYTPAYIELAKMYHGGRGVAKNRTTAEYWYKKASDAGNAEARRILLNM